MAWKLNEISKKKTGKIREKLPKNWTKNLCKKSLKIGVNVRDKKIYECDEKTVTKVNIVE